MKRRMHAEYPGKVSHRFVVDGKTLYKTSCWLTVDGSQIAGFESGITCKRCAANIQSEREQAEWWQARRAETARKQAQQEGGAA